MSIVLPDILNLQSLCDQANAKDDRIYFTSIYCENLADIENEIYDIKDISLFDMFPNTYHVETVVCLRKEQ